MFKRAKGRVVGIGVVTASLSTYYLILYAKGGWDYITGGSFGLLIVAMVISFFIAIVLE